MYFDFAQYEGNFLLRNKQKGAAHLLLILVTVILLAGGIYFYQTNNKKTVLQSPTTTLQQPKLNDYTNSELGFSFQYPQDLTVKADSEEEFNKRGKTDFKKNFQNYVGYAPPDFLGAIAVLDKTESYEINPFSVWVFDNPHNLSAEKWFDSYWYYPFLWGVFDWTSKGHVALDTETTVSGLIGKSKIVSYQTGQPKYVYFSKDQKMYLLRVIGETGEKILPTFKFLE
ncbi:MAG: hypothetical protein Q7S44_01720 [bacterium]|nr:hypothetical protein [bacterium]